MLKQARLLILLGLCVLCLVSWSGCGDDDGDSSPTGPGTVLLNQDATVPGGGGSADVSFSADSGLTIRITLTASDASLEPYGYLTSPDGSGDYTPQSGMAQNGVNSAELALSQTGTYGLTIFDSTNQGGAIHVNVEVL